MKDQDNCNQAYVHKPWPAIEYGLFERREFWGRELSLLSPKLPDQPKTENRKPEERLRRKKAWQVYPEQPELVAAVMARHNLPRLVARILLNRGLAAADDILAFLDPSLERLNPPFELPDLEVAAARLGRAVRQGEPVAVYGDYDADGITATAVLHQFLRELGLPCIPYIPDRLTQGYGLKIEALKELALQDPARGHGGLRHQ